MWWLILISFVVGAFFGVIVMGCMAASKMDELITEMNVSKRLETEEKNTKV